MPSYVKLDRIVRTEHTKTVPKIDIHFALTPSNRIAFIIIITINKNKPHE